MAHYPAAFINEIRESGTKTEAVHWLQVIWNERCEFERQLKEADETRYDLQERLGRANDRIQTVERRAFGSLSKLVQAESKTIIYACTECPKLAPFKQESLPQQ